MTRGCPSCQEINHPWAEVCEECGAPLVPTPRELETALLDAVRRRARAAKVDRESAA